MVRISPKQLFALIVLYEIGSTTLYALGIKAKQDAWISFLIGMLGGLILTWILLELQKNFPEKNLVEIIIALLGKWIGVPLVILYFFYFQMICSFVFREFGEVMIITFLPKTPISVVLTIYMLVVVYIIFLGLEVLGRMSEILLPIVLFFLVLVYMLIYFSGEVHFSDLQPVLGEGLPTIFEASFRILVFPFGEMCLFMMYWKYVQPKHAIRKTTFWAVVISGLLLTYSTITFITVLGPEYAGNATIPLLNVIKLINIGDILTHMDALGVMMIFMGGLFKMVLLLYASILILCYLINVRNQKWFIVIVSLYTLLFGIFYFTSHMYHHWLGGLDMFDGKIHPIFAWVFPPLLLVLCWIQKLKKKLLESD